MACRGDGGEREMKKLNKHAEHTYEFRPTPGFFVGEVRRYAGGEWLPDDGEYDLAFIGSARGGYPCCLMVELPYQHGIAWSGLTSHWSANDDNHPRGNAWHYMLHENCTEWGGDWGRDRHANTKAGRSGMSKMSSEKGCANGRHVEFNLDDKHIAAGLLRMVETKEVVKFPEHPVCMYCGDLWAEKIKQLKEQPQ